MVRLTSWDMDLEFNKTEKRYGFNEERNSMELDREIEDLLYTNGCRIEYASGYTVHLVGLLLGSTIST